MSLNELTPALEKVVYPTDSRLRPDIRKLENGDHDGAGAEKARLEDKQRESRKARKHKKGQEWTPRYGIKKYMMKLTNFVNLWARRVNSSFKIFHSHFEGIISSADLSLYLFIFFTFRFFVFSLTLKCVVGGMILNNLFLYMLPSRR